MELDLQLLHIASRHHSLIDVRQLDRMGISQRRWERRVDAGAWVQVTPTHFRHVAAPLTFEMQVRAGAAWLGSRGALFGTTALHWVGAVDEIPDKAEFLVHRSLRSIPNWMTLHTSNSVGPTTSTQHRGVRTTTAARAVMDVASQMPSARRLESIIDQTIRSRRTTLDRLCLELATVARQGRRGVVMLRELLLDSGGESYLERRFLRLVREGGLPRPACQVVHRNDGKHVARVDFQWGNVVVEVSGRLGHVTDRERQKDARRRNGLQRLGLLVLEFTTADVIDDPDYVLRTLRTSLPTARR
jgi:hypothetical protein